MKNFKLVVVGDGAVGKTCLLFSITKGSFPSEYVPLIFDSYANTIFVDNRAYILCLWDTAGKEEHDRLRPLGYPDTDAFLVCFDVANRNSFENIEHKWIPEIRHYSPDSANILVGTKIDLRSNAAENNRSPQSCVTYEEGKQLATRLGISTYLECSALTHDGIDAIIPTAMRTAVRENLSKKESRFRSNGKKILSRKRDSALEQREYEERKINTSKDSKCSVI